MQKIRPTVFLANLPALQETFKTSISESLLVFGPLTKLVNIRLLAQVLTPSVKADVTIKVDKVLSSYNRMISFFIYLGNGDMYIPMPFFNASYTAQDSFPSTKKFLSN